MNLIFETDLNMIAGGSTAPVGTYNLQLSQARINTLSAIISTIGGMATGGAFTLGCAWISGGTTTPICIQGGVLVGGTVGTLLNDVLKSALQEHLDATNGGQMLPPNDDLSFIVMDNGWVQFTTAPTWDPDTGFRCEA